MEDFVNCGNISISKERCIRTTFSKSHCRDCEDICIVDAIIFSPTPSINKNLCIQCGLCYAACKFSAINIKKDNKQLLKACENKKIVDIGCIFSNSDIKVTCLSRLTEDLLASWLLNDKKIILKKGNCKSCKFKETLSYFNSSFKKAVILAQSANKKPNVTVKTDKSKHVYIPKESVSRRNLFSGLKVVPAKPISKRRILQEIVPTKPVNDFLYPDSADLSIDSSCTLCGVCAHICPVGAIEIKKYEDKGFIFFSPSLCVACDACSEACLYNSITITQKTISNINSKPKKIFGATKKKCKTCNKEFYSENENDEICHTCKLKEDGKKQFLDFLKNL